MKLLLLVLFVLVGIFMLMGIVAIIKKPGSGVLSGFCDAFFREK